LPWQEGRAPAFQAFAGMTIGVNANLISKLPAEQLPDGHLEMLADQIPKGRLHAAHGIMGVARYRAGPAGRPAQLARESLDMARVLAHEDGRQISNNPRQPR